MLTDIFKNRKPNYEKLIEFGFKKVNDTYIQKYPLLENQFTLTVSIKESKISLNVIDNETNFPYSLYENSERGSFSGQVNQEIKYILTMLNQMTFYNSTYQTVQALQIIDYVSKKYHTSLEFLWPKFPGHGILRRNDTNKWYGGIFLISADKIGINDSSMIEVLNLRIDPLRIGNLIDNVTFFPAYHMNKKNWISIKLNNEELPSIFIKMIDWSFEKAK